MKYTCEIIIHDKKEQVAACYVQHEHILKWEKGLTDIIDYQGHLFETGSQGAFLFDFGNYQMEMKITVEENQLPDRIIQIFEVPGAWNRCDNRFIAMGDQTKWIMDVIFEFDEKQDLPVEPFIQKTTEAMQIFKDYVEGLKNI